MNSLKAYVVQERPFDWMCGQSPVLVFAKNARQAKSIGVKYIEYEDYKEIRCRREKRADGWDIKPTEPSALQMGKKTDAYFRDLGWHYEGDDMCEDCGEYSMDGLFPVCFECFYCSECGHHEDCSERRAQG